MSFKLRQHSISSWTSEADILHADIDLLIYGGDNNILNFGPYQYVVTFTSPTGYFVMVSKLEFVVVICVRLSLRPVLGTPFGGTLIAEGDYFPFIEYDTTAKTRSQYVQSLLRADFVMS